MEFIGYLTLIGIGITLSVIGGGGSLLSVPILVYLFSLDIVTASSYSLFIVGTTSLLGAVLKQKEQRIDVRYGVIFSTCSVIAIFLTRKWIVPSIPDVMLLGDGFLVTKRALILAVFVVLTITAAIVVLFRRTASSCNNEKPNLTLLLPVSFATGMLVGFVGAGGGFLILPSLIAFARLPFNIAIGTTLLVIAFNSLIGFLGDVMNYSINWIFLLTVTGMATMGMLLGNRYCTKIPVQYLRTSLSCVMLITAIVILIKELII